jgi:TrpR-related protein YerC/YecD
LDAVDELSEVVALLENAEEIRDLLRDLLTPDEIEVFAARWRVMRLLAEGSRPSEVHKTTGVSRTTIGRARRVVRYGTGIVGKLAERFENRGAVSDTPLTQKS